jgi:hypothetical protein
VGTGFVLFAKACPCFSIRNKQVLVCVVYLTGKEFRCQTLMRGLSGRITVQLKQKTSVWGLFSLTQAPRFFKYCPNNREQVVGMGIL